MFHCLHVFSGHYYYLLCFWIIAEDHVGEERPEGVGNRPLCVPDAPGSPLFPGCFGHSKPLLTSEPLNLLVSHLPDHWGSGLLLAQTFPPLDTRTVRMLPPCGPHRLTRSCVLVPCSLSGSCRQHGEPGRVGRPCPASLQEVSVGLDPEWTWRGRWEGWDPPRASP